MILMHALTSTMDTVSRSEGLSENIFRVYANEGLHDPAAIFHKGGIRTI